MGQSLVYMPHDETNDVLRPTKPIESDLVGTIHKLTQAFDHEQFTDGGAAAGTLALSVKLPAGAWVLRAFLNLSEAFAAAGTVVMTVGDGSDVDRYNAGTPNVKVTGYVDLGAPSGTQVHTALTTVTLTVTEGTDFGNVTAGAGTITIVYLEPFK